MRSPAVLRVGLSEKVGRNLAGVDALQESSPCHAVLADVPKEDETAVVAPVTSLLEPEVGRLPDGLSPATTTGLRLYDDHYKAPCRDTRPRRDTRSKIYFRAAEAPVSLGVTMFSPFSRSSCHGLGTPILPTGHQSCPLEIHHRCIHLRCSPLSSAFQASP